MACSKIHVYSILRNHDKTYWVATDRGAYTIKDNQATVAYNPNLAVEALLPIASSESILWLGYTN